MRAAPLFAILLEIEKKQEFKIKTLNQDHDCEPAYENHRANADTLAYYFRKKVQNNPRYKLKDMKRDLEEHFKLNVSQSKMKRVKRLVLEKLEGSYFDDYNRLEAYAQKLRETSLGSDVVINISKDALAEGRKRFLRMYLCFNTLKKGWKGGLRPLIGLDGIFLKGKYKGILLVAVAQNSVKYFYPLAWAMVDKEMIRTWSWFMKLLKISLDLKDGEGVTFILDMQKGLLDDVSKVVPQAHRRYCLRHIEAN